MPESRAHIPVVLEVSTTEIIPVICTIKGHNLATGEKMNPSRRTSDTDSALQFYLIDCRPESIASEQGRFPTAVSLSPEKLQDPDELQKLTDMFESLRSAVHICVMVSITCHPSIAFALGMNGLKNAPNSHTFHNTIIPGRGVCIIPCTLQALSLKGRREVA